MFSKEKFTTTQKFIDLTIEEVKAGIDNARAKGIQVYYPDDIEFDMSIFDIQNLVDDTPNITTIVVANFKNKEGGTRIKFSVPFLR